MTELSRFCRITLVVTFAVTVFTASGNAWSNQNSPLGKTFLPASCEDSEAYLDLVANEAQDALTEGRVLIAVARIGDGESLHSLNRDRLAAVRTYLVRRGLPAPNIVSIRGERVRGAGRVEFYISGKLSRIILARRNRSICIECCNPSPEDFTRRLGTKKRAVSRH